MANQLANHQPLPTPINVDELEYLLTVTNYPSHLTLYLLHGFRYGFSTNYQGDQSPLFSTNSHSALLNPEQVDLKLQNELQQGRIAGPFSSPPLPNFKSSPLALREKSTPGKFRLLHNLSYPYDSRSVNANIPQQSSTVQYSNIQTALEVVRDLGSNCFLAKSDIADAFRLIPLNPSEYNLTGFEWRGQYYFDKCLAMGLSSSCKIFETFTDAIRWILIHHYKVGHCIKILDDFLFIELTSKKCQEDLQAFLHLCKRLGIPVAIHKTVGPVTTIVFVGIEIDTVAMETRLPLEKLQSYSDHLKDMLARSKTTLRDLQSLIGQLHFATSCVPGRPFLRRLIDLTMQAKKPYHLIRLTKEAKSDLKLWLTFLETYNGCNIIGPRYQTPSDHISFCTDASKTGYAGTFGTHWIQGQFPESWKSLNIAFLELYPIYLLVKIFAHKIQNSALLFYCDNEAITTIINKQTSKDKTIMILLRPLVLTLLKYNISFHAKHITSKSNYLCDKLSRFQVQPALLRHFGMRSSPTPVPEDLQPHSFTI